jgi:D-psicose/D-tagatose/L-ribulose 3-epimerase
MNKIGIYYAYWTQDWDVDFHVYVDKAAGLGFDVLEVHAGAIAGLSTAMRKRLIGHAAARGIELSYCIGLSADCDVASEDAQVRKNGVRFLEEMARAIGDMGGGRLSGILYGAWPALVPEGVSDKRPFLDRSVASLKEAIKVAEDQNVVFNFEAVNRFDQFLINTPEEALAFVQQVDSPNAKILLDIFHMNIKEDTISAAVQTAGSYLGHVHLGENNRKAPGYGHIPWKELARALKKVDYQGWLVMVPFLFSSGQVGRDVRVRRGLGKGMDLNTEAARAVHFARARLAEV